MTNLTSGMQLPTRQQIAQRFQRLDNILGTKSGSTTSGPHPEVLVTEPSMESVEAKWEGLQYFEDSSYCSLASNNSSASSSTSTANKESEGDSGVTDNSTKAKLNRLRRQSWRKIKSQFSKRSSTSRKDSGSTNMDSRLSYGDLVCTDPAAADEEAKQNGQTNNMKLKASKSMQNLEQLTFFGLREATSSLKQLYHSRTELRDAKPKASYQELWDEDDVDARHFKILTGVGLA